MARGGVQVCEAGLHAAAGTADGNLTLLELSDNLVQCSRYILYPSHVNFPPLPVITVTKNNLNLRIKAKHVKDEADATVFVWFVCLHTYTVASAPSGSDFFNEEILIIFGTVYRYRIMLHTLYQFL